MADLDDVRARGFAIVDQELELGVRSVAAPLHDAAGRTIAAVNVSTHVNRTTKAQLQRRLAPAVLRTAERIDHALANRPA
jgi:IclR family pca regulon transcriptional regulator